jgi:hypothetical protein|tara:strand:- start:1567 stop:3210 length:1644 start_codon:yes stop_codon:yes gene_type:complete
MTQLFGFSIEERKKKEKLYSPAPPNNDEGTSTVAAGAYFGQYVDLDGIPKNNNDFELIKKYREIALHPECDSAIDDIINESISSDLDFAPVNIELSNLEVGDKIKKQIREEFRLILKLLDFDKKCHDIFRRWYIDGRMHYHKMIDFENPQEGIKELRYIDALKIKKVREVVKKKATIDNVEKGPNGERFDYGEVLEYYMYFPHGYKAQQAKGLKIANDAICSVNSGLMDHNRNTVLSFLHKAIKSVNQLRMIEDSLVIYRLSRAPERRIFYIDVGNLPKMKAEQYLREVMNRYRNKLVYDSNTGEVRDDRKHMSMLEDFWLPRREGGRGTEITTLPGGQNLGELEDVKYFQKKLYKSLNIPLSRLEQESSFTIGRTNEITRDELKFAKFVGRLRKKFSELFHDLLKTQLVLKGIMTLEDWEELKENIQYDFIFDNHFTELKDNELLTERLNSVGMIEPYLGKYFSAEYVRKQVLHFTDEEIEEMDIQIEKEKSLGIIQDPMAMMGDEMGGGQLPPAEGGAENGGGGGDLDSAFAAAISPSDYNKGNI